MNAMDLALLIVIAAICGFIASQVMGARRMHIVMMILLGFIGALAGKLIYTYFDLPVLWEVNIGGHIFPIVWALIGSIIVIGLYSFIQQH